jgi:hypothetical protein
LCLSAGNKRNRIGKEMALFSQSLRSLGAPDCPVVHQTVSGAPGWLWRTCCSRDFDGGVRYKSPDCPVVHRTVRWCTRQCPVRQAGSGELAALGTSTAVYGINHQTVWWCTGLSGEPFTDEVVGLGKPSTAYGYNSPDCPVEHRTVW